MSYKTVSREDVRRVAHALITLNRQTTTLEVKNALRNLGFWATQDEVRNYMLDITSKDGEIQYEDRGFGYRTYRFHPSTVQSNHTFNTQGVCTACGRSQDAVAYFNWTDCPKIMSDVGSSVRKPTTPTVPTSPSWTLTTASISVHRDNIPADYKVTDKWGGFARTYINVTRPQAKREWERDTGLPFTGARTTKM